MASTGAGFEDDLHGAPTEPPAQIPSLPTQHSEPELLTLPRIPGATKLGATQSTSRLVGSTTPAGLGGNESRVGAGAGMSPGSGPAASGLKTGRLPISMSTFDLTGRLSKLSASGNTGVRVPVAVAVTKTSVQSSSTSSLSLSARGTHSAAANASPQPDPSISGHRTMSSSSSTPNFHQLAIGRSLAVNTTSQGNDSHHQPSATAGTDNPVPIQCSAPAPPPTTVQSVVNAMAQHVSKTESAIHHSFESVQRRRGQVGGVHSDGLSPATSQDPSDGGQLSPVDGEGPLLVIRDDGQTQADEVDPKGSESVVTDQERALMEARSEDPSTIEAHPSSTTNQALIASSLINTSAQTQRPNYKLVRTNEAAERRHAAIKTKHGLEQSDPLRAHLPVKAPLIERSENFVPDVGEEASLMKTHELLNLAGVTAGAARRARRIVDCEAIAAKLKMLPADLATALLLEPFGGPLPKGDRDAEVMLAAERWKNANSRLLEGVKRLERVSSQSALLSAPSPTPSPTIATEPSDGSSSPRVRPAPVGTIATAIVQQHQVRSGVFPPPPQANVAGIVELEASGVLAPPADPSVVTVSGASARGCSQSGMLRLLKENELLRKTVFQLRMVEEHNAQLQLELDVLRRAGRLHSDEEFYALRDELQGATAEVEASKMRQAEAQAIQDALRTDLASSKFALSEARALLDARTAELNALSAVAQSQEARLKALQNQNARLTAERNAEMQEVHRLRQLLTQVEERSRQAAVTAETASKHADDLKKQLSAEQIRLTTASEDKAQFESQLRAEREKLTRLTQIEASQRAELERVQHELKQAAAQLAQAKSDLEAASNEARQFKALVDITKQEKTTLEEQTADIIKKLNAQLQLYIRERNALQKKHDELTKESQQNEKMMRFLEAEKKVLEDNMQKERAQAERVLAAVNEELSALKEEHEQCATSMRRKEEELDVARRSINELTHDLHHTENELDVALTEKHALNDRLSQLENELNDVKDLLTQRVAQLEVFVEKDAKNEQTISRLNSELETTREQLNIVQERQMQSLTIAKKAVAKAEAAERKLEEGLREKDQEIDALKAIVSNLENEREVLRAAGAEAEARINRLLEQEQERVEALEAAQAQSDSLRARADELETKVKDLEERLAFEQQQLENALTAAKRARELRIQLDEFASAKRIAEEQRAGIQKLLDEKNMKLMDVQNQLKATRRRLAKLLTDTQGGGEAIPLQEDEDMEALGEQQDEISGSKVDGTVPGDGDMPPVQASPQSLESSTTKNREKLASAHDPAADILLQQSDVAIAMKAAHSKHGQLQDTINNLNSQINMLKDENAMLSEKLAKAESQHRNCDITISHLDSQVRSLKAAVAADSATRLDREAAHSRFLLAQKEVDTLQLQLAEAERRLRAAQDEADELRQRLLQEQQLRLSELLRSAAATPEIVSRSHSASLESEASVDTTDTQDKTKAQRQRSTIPTRLKSQRASVTGKSTVSVPRPQKPARPSVSQPAAEQVPVPTSDTASVASSSEANHEVVDPELESKEDLDDEKQAEGTVKVDTALWTKIHKEWQLVNKELFDAKSMIRELQLDLEHWKGAESKLRLARDRLQQTVTDLEKERDQLSKDLEARQNEAASVQAILDKIMANAQQTSDPSAVDASSILPSKPSLFDSHTIPTLSITHLVSTLKQHLVEAKAKLSEVESMRIELAKSEAHADNLERQLAKLRSDYDELLHKQSTQKSHEADHSDDEAVPARELDETKQALQFKISNLEIELSQVQETMASSIMERETKIAELEREIVHLKKLLVTANIHASAQQQDLATGGAGAGSTALQTVQQQTAKFTMSLLSCVEESSFISRAASKWYV